MAANGLARPGPDIPRNIAGRGIKTGQIEAWQFAKVYWGWRPRSFTKFEAEIRKGGVEENGAYQ